MKRRDRRTSLGNSQRGGSPPPPAPSARGPRAIELHIGELVLSGLPAPDPATLADELEVALARRFAEGGVPEALASHGDRAELRAGSLDLSRPSEAGAIGARVADLLYRSLSERREDR